MKKLALAAIAASSALVSTPAFAQFGTSDTDTTTITASVALVCTIDAPTGGVITVNSTTAIGNSAAQCNDPDGFTATLTSANAGVLKALQASNTTTVPYTITIAGAGTYDLTTPASLPRTPGDQVAVDGFALPTSINAGNFNGPAFAGTYQDVITYLITPN